MDRVAYFDGFVHDCLDLGPEIERRSKAARRCFRRYDNKQLYKYDRLKAPLELKATPKYFLEYRGGDLATRVRGVNARTEAPLVRQTGHHPP